MATNGLESTVGHFALTVLTDISIKGKLSPWGFLISHFSDLAEKMTISHGEFKWKVCLKRHFPCWLTKLTHSEHKISPFQINAVWEVGEKAFVFF